MTDKSAIDPTLLDDDAGPLASEPSALLASPDPSADTVGAETDGDAVVLTLEDLMADDAGEVVLAADNVAISLKTEGHVVDGGVVADHVTATGVDVSGLSYATLDSGITIYYSGQVELLP